MKTNQREKGKKTIKVSKRFWAMLVALVLAISVVPQAVLASDSPSSAALEAEASLAPAEENFTVVEDIPAEAVLDEVSEKPQQPAPAEEPDGVSISEIAAVAQLEPAAAEADVSMATLQSDAIAVDGYTGSYDGQAHGVTVTGAEGLDIEYATSATGPFSPEPITLKDAGTATVFIQAKDDGDNVVGSGSATIQINKQPVTVQLATAVPHPTFPTSNISSLYKIYGNADPTITPVITGVVAGEQLAYSVAIAPESIPANVKSMPYGRAVTLTLDATAEVNKNYAISYLDYLGRATTEANGKKGTLSYLTRDSGVVSPSYNTSAAYNIEYGDTVPNLLEDVKYTNVLPEDVSNVSLVVQTGTPARYVWDSTNNKWVAENLAAVPAEEIVPGKKLDAAYYPYNFWANNSGRADANGNTAQNMRYVNKSGLYYLLVNPKSVTITAADAEKVLGGTDPQLTATMTETAYGETIEYTVSREPGETAGTYATHITVDEGAYPNYDITTVPGTFTIKEKAPIVVPTKQAVTITANNAEKFVGEADPAFTSTVTGIANSSAIEYTLSRVPGETVGTYAIQVNVNESAYPGYAITTVPAIFTIKEQAPIIDPEKRAVTITANDAEKFVGEADPQLTGTMTKIVDGDSIAYTLSREPGETVGTYAIQVNLDKAAYPSYEITTQPGVFTIKAVAPKPAEKKHEVTITANDAQKFVGQADPELTATMTKIVDGDSINYTLSRVPGEIVGTYAINVNVDESAYPNYTITTVQGTFTILPVVDPVEPPVTPAGETPAAAGTTAPPIVPGETTPTDPTDPGNPTSTINDGATPLGGSAEDPSVTKDFGTGDTPLAQGSTYWALLNLILAILTSVIMLVLLASFFAGKNRRKEEQSSDSETGKLRRKGLIRLLSIIPTVVAIVLFLLTENMSNPMILTDQWTVLMAVIAIAQIVVAFFATKSRKKDKHEGHMETPQTQNA